MIDSSSLFSKQPFPFLHRKGIAIQYKSSELLLWVRLCRDELCIISCAAQQRIGGLESLFLSVQQHKELLLQQQVLCWGDVGVSNFTSKNEEKAAARLKGQITARTSDRMLLEKS